MLVLCGLLFGLLHAPIPAHAQSHPVHNLNRKGVAVKGHDPVAFFTVGTPVKGRSELSTSVNGATYWFATEENKAAFDKDPAKYEPQFGGYCAYGVSVGQKIGIDPDAFQIVEGRLLLQYSKGVRDTFNEDTAGNLRLADAKWTDVSKLK